MKKVLTFIIVSIVLLLPVYSLANTINVPGDQPNIQAGIDAAVDGDTVLIANGTYTGNGNHNINFNGKSITVKSVNGPANCIIDCQYLGRGFLGYNNETIVINGLTIKNADAGNDNGGAIYMYDSPLTIKNCIFTNNNASTGGAVFISSDECTPLNSCSSPPRFSFTSCTFTGNTNSAVSVHSNSTLIVLTGCTFTNNEGGAVSYSSIFISAPSFSFTNCNFTNNTGTLSISSGTFTNCTFTGNTGGAVSASSSTFTNCTFTGNTGGAVSASSSTFTNCTFSNNSNIHNSFFPFDSNHGGSVVDISSSSFINCIFTGNHSSKGGAVHISSSSTSTSFANCTFTGNEATDSGGAIWCDIPLTPKNPISIKNCILWGNTAPEGDQIYEEEKPLIITYSNIQGGHAGNGNINLDPLFVDALDGDIHLRSGSPCIDTGTADGAPTKDLDGYSRPQGSGYDMGVYEYVSGCHEGDLINCHGLNECQNAGGYWYDNQCHAQPQPQPTPNLGNHNAAPSHALPVVEYPTSVTPSNNTVQVGACDDIMIQPTLSVPSADVGKNATLIMYIYIPDAGFGMNLPSRTKILASETKFDLLLHAIDFSESPNLNLYIYYGYVLDSGTIKYNAYSIMVGASCDHSAPDCGAMSDASLCNANSGCEWQAFPTTKCILKCSQFTSQSECQSAFGGACDWNMLFDACVPK